MNLDGRLSAVLDSILRFETRLARLAQPIVRVLDPPHTLTLDRPLRAIEIDRPVAAPSRAAA